MGDQLFEMNGGTIWTPVVTTTDNGLQVRLENSTKNILLPSINVISPSNERPYDKEPFHPLNPTLTLLIDPMHQTVQKIMVDGEGVRYDQSYAILKQDDLHSTRATIFTFIAVRLRRWEHHDYITSVAKTRPGQRVPPFVLCIRNPRKTPKPCIKIA